MAGYENGLGYLDVNGQFKGLQAKGSWNFGEINCLLALDQWIYVGTEQHGVVRINKNKPWVQQLYPSAGMQIKALYADKSQNVFCLGRDGLSMLNTSLEWIGPELNIGLTRALCTLNDGSVWFASTKGLQSISYDRAGKAMLQQHGLNNVAITSMASDKVGNIWIGTFESGLIQFNTLSKQVVKHDLNKALANNNVLCPLGLPTTALSGYVLSGA